MGVTRIVNKIFKSCSYILWSEQNQDAYLIDCGDTRPILQLLSISNKKLRGVFLTHAHFDHIYGLNRLVEALEKFKIYASRESIEALYQPRINLSKYHGDDFILTEDAETIEINSNSKIELWGRDIEVIHTPGHDSGCLCYQIEEKLFTGDSYIPEVPVFTKWKRSNKEEALYWEEELKNRVEAHNYKLYSGHAIYD